jgi:two-component system nitrate/nitrite response regulator NarL
VDVPGPIRLVIVAGVRLYREGLAVCLENCSTVRVTGIAGSMSEALELARSSDPDVVLLDVGMPDGLYILPLLNRHCERTRIIAFAIDKLDDSILACAACNVAGYLSVDSTVDQLVAMVERVMAGGTHCHPNLAAVLLSYLATVAESGQRKHWLDALTPRQKEIAVLIRAGLSNKQIAVQLVIEVSTVKNHVHAILEKLHVGNRIQASARLFEPPRSASQHN